MLELVRTADVVVEGMRPGVAERLGLGPTTAATVNERIVYGRMTGWGQDGPLAQAAGHDMNYIAITGALHMMGQDPERPQFPANLVGDFGGGSTYLVIGILAALLEARVSGQGQVVDAAIVDGTAHLNAMTAAFPASGGFKEERGANLLDGGVPFYDIYETADGKHMSVGALEPQFFDALVTAARRQGDLPRPGRHGPVRRDARGLHRDLQAADPGRVGRDLRGHRRLRGRHPPDQRGRRTTRTWWPGRRSSSTTGWCSRSRRRGSPGPPRPSACRPARWPAQHTRDALAAWGIADVDGLIERGVAVQT